MWTRDLRFHPRVHAIVLQCLQRAGLLNPMRELEDPEAFDRLMVRLAETRWVVYAKSPFRRIEHVLAYLGATRIAWPSPMVAWST
jgi:hypothetical protein